MKLWIPDGDGRDAIGQLPEGVALSVTPREGELPAEMLEAEFLVPRAGDRRIVEMLPRMRVLRVIQTLSAGVDRLVGIVPGGVVLCDAGGTRDVAVAEWVLAAILASTRSLGELRDRQREHVWRWCRSRELAGATVMILGYGAIGAAVEARLRPFDVSLIRVARTAREGVHAVGELEALLPGAEVLVVLVPLTSETVGLLDRRMLDLLPQDALLVNAARGRVLDGEALLALAQAGRVRAVLDVTDPEPLPAEHPLWDAPGVLITPHFAGDTAAADRRAFAFAGEQVRRYVRGEKLSNVVEHGY
ncbi:MAG TPA: NAD(P)-dependent oxidoreductase [Solirubrobacteraceae bacterium]|nr:NAD(P)-dependent oxidoreductase [Solirubrobacteraceae bacterium]